METVNLPRRRAAHRVSLRIKLVLVYRTNMRDLAFAILLIGGMSLALGLVSCTPPAVVRDPTAPVAEWPNYGNRLRHTFAVGLLQKGVSMGNVSTLLGHRGMRITEKYYASWVAARQQHLEEEVRRAW